MEFDLDAFAASLRLSDETIAATHRLGISNDNPIIASAPTFSYQEISVDQAAKLVEEQIKPTYGAQVSIDQINQSPFIVKDEIDHLSAEATRHEDLTQIEEQKFVIRPGESIHTSKTDAPQRVEVDYGANGKRVSTASVAHVTRIRNYMNRTIYSRDARGNTYSHNTEYHENDYVSNKNYERGILIQITTLFSTHNDVMRYVRNMKRRKDMMSDEAYHKLIAEKDATLAVGYKLVSDYWIPEALFNKYPNGLYHFYTDMAIGHREDIYHPKERNIVFEGANETIEHIHNKFYRQATTSTVNYVNNAPDAKCLYTRFVDEAIEIKPVAGVPQQAINGKGEVVIATEYVEFITYDHLRMGSNTPKSSKSLYTKRFTVDHPDLHLYGVYKSVIDALNGVDNTDKYKAEINNLQKSIEFHKQENKTQAAKHADAISSMKEKHASEIQKQAAEHAKKEIVSDIKKAVDDTDTVKQKSDQDLKQALIKTEIETIKAQAAKTSASSDTLKATASIIAGVIALVAIVRTVANSASSSVVSSMASGFTGGSSGSFNLSSGSSRSNVDSFINQARFINYGVMPKTFGAYF